MTQWMATLTLVFLTGALAGGWVGWLLGTRALYTRSADDLEPALVRLETPGLVFAQRKRDRIIRAGLYALIWASAGAMPLAVLIR